MFSSAVLKSALLGGFEKTSVENCLNQLLASVNQLEFQLGLPQTEFDSTALKKVRFGSGYDKTSVLTYIDILLTRMNELQKSLEK